MKLDFVFLIFLYQYPKGTQQLSTLDSFWYHFAFFSDHDLGIYILMMSYFGCCGRKIQSRVQETLQIILLQ